MQRKKRLLFVGFLAALLAMPLASAQGGVWSDIKSSLSDLGREVNSWIPRQSIRPVKKPPKSYPMVCRGGAGMTVQLDQRGKNSNNVLVYFKKAAKGASYAPPAPGHCAWLDRGLNRKEPAVMILPVGKVKLMADCGPNGCRVYRVENPFWNYAVKAVTSGEPFQVHVYNCANGGCGKRKSGFRVSRVGP